MTTKIVLIVLCVMFFALCCAAEAQPPAKIYRIGYLAPGSASALGARMDAFRQGLRELGYVEGKNIFIERRHADGKLDRLPAIAAQLVRLKVEVIVTGGSASTRAAQETTSAIPIVMTQDPDPIGSGFITSLARPGGNITGLSNLVSDLSGKRLELLKETIPKLSRVALFGTSTTPGNTQQLKEAELASSPLGLKIQYLDVLGPKDIETAFRTARKEQADAVLVLAGSIFNSYRKQIADLAIKSRLPAIYINPEYVEDGGLMSYGASINDLYRRAATYVDKILKGAKPADLPVEQPMKFEFIINLKAAKQIRLTIPPNVLARADRVIR
jgi:putative ABC transport system substrate-binding protein